MMSALPVDLAFSTTGLMSHGDRNWPFLMFTGLPGAHLADEIGLAHREGRRLQHVDDGRDFVHRRVFVHVGQHRHAELALHLGQHAQPFLHARAAEAVERGAVGLVEAGLEDEIDAELAGDLLQRRRGVDLQLFALDHARAGDQEERLVEADIEAAELLRVLRRKNGI